MDKLKIEYVDINSIKPYKNNAKLHPQEQIEQIKKSIEQFGMDDPIGIWKDEIVEGHGRLIACKELGYTEVPIIRLDHLSDEERKAYTLAHNKLTMNSDFDIDILNEELKNITNINMEELGFMLETLEETIERIESVYTNKINIPIYEAKEEEPSIKELVDEGKVNEILEEIKKSNLDIEKKEFLKKATTRLYKFNYSKIAEYYAHQNKEMQSLMEKIALVINEDVNSYIINGMQGKLMFTIYKPSIIQTQTQKNKGGLTDIYLDNGTYVKSFYSVIVEPSCAKVAIMNTKNPRIHHKILWNNCTPKILNEKYKKK